MDPLHFPAKKNYLPKEGLRRTNDMLKQIKDKFKRIKDLDNVVKRSTKMYFDSYITSLSSDPRVQSNMLSITEAFEDENFFQFWLADSQETHIPIVRIVLKQMMNQLRASEIEARDKKIAFTSAISASFFAAWNFLRCAYQSEIGRAHV